MKFKLVFNSETEEKKLPNDNYSVNDLLADLDLSSQTIVPKINNEIVVEDSIIRENDEVQIIQIIYGG